ncbi:MAG: hypothetical protein HKO93_02075 [Flavobacteriales bacterium]|nr:hypothetical protein [Flavobacteriales bacterium]
MISKRNLSIVTLLLLSTFLFGQDVKDRTTDKAETKANTRIDSKVDEGLDKGFDAIEGLFRKKKKKKKGGETETSSEASGTAIGAADESEVEEIQEKEVEVIREEAPDNAEQDRKKKEYQDQYANMFNNMFQAAEWEDSYTFDLVSEATITTTNKKGKQEVNHMNMYASEKAFGMKMDDQQQRDTKGFVVFDFENESFITLTEKDGKKEGMAIAMTADQKSIMGGEGIKETMEKEYKDVRFTKTGRSKMIADRLSWEYTGEGEGGEGVMWMAEDINFDGSKFFGLYGNSKGRQDFMPDYYPEGYLMEMDYKDYETGERNHYIVTRLDDKAREVVDTSTYDVKDMKSMMENGGKR